MRRRVLQVGGMSALGLLIAACSSSGKSGTGPAAPGGKPVRGGDLVFATNLEISTLDPAFSQNFSERFAYYALYNTLVAYDKDFNIVPELAESWETADDGKTLTLHLRRGVKFHDSTNCDAAAVKWNLDRILDKATNSPIRGSLTPPLNTITVVDDATVRLSLDKPWRPLLAALGERPGFVVSPTAVQKYGKDYGLHPVGTGPFKFERFNQDSELVMTRFDGYWDSGKPYLNSITMRHVPDQQVQLTMLRTGEAHIGDKLTAQLAVTVQKSPGITLEKRATGNWYAMQMDCDKAPFNNPDLRQAIAYATDRVGVQKALFKDEARIATGPIGIGWAYDSSDTNPAYPFDIEKAKSLVQRAGAQGISVDYVNSGQSDYQAVAQLLQAGYSKLGMNLKVGTVPASDYYNLVVKDKLNWTLTTWTPRADPDGLLRILFHSTGSQNTTGYKNPQVDALLDKAAGMFDNHAASEIYRQVQDIVEKDAPYVWVVWPDMLVAHSDKVAGVTLYPDAIHRLREMWLRA
jgi:peptide/nickel transport system substrate-binding protein